jgi:hypothetical protein
MPAWQIIVIAASAALFGRRTGGDRLPDAGRAAARDTTAA